MLANDHTHTTYCDGKNSAREMILSAIDKGFDILGFSGHGFTAHDFTYCMMKTDEYIKELRLLQEEFKDKIEVLVGVEEDRQHYVNRDDFDFIIGSSHYFFDDGVFHHVDHSPEGMKEAIDFVNGDYLKLADRYYNAFCRYILARKPDIVGHFDLVTKFDEITPTFLPDAQYNRMAEKYIESVADSGCIFEVNTGAISRGYRSLPYPAQNLLYVLKKHGTKITITSDCHAAENLDCFYAETRKILSDTGFEYITLITRDGLKKDYLK